MGVLSTIRGLISRPDAPSATSPLTRMRSEYMRGGRGVTFAGWKPALRDAQDDVSLSWDAAAARLTDFVQNNGWIAGAIDQCVANTVGTGLRLKAQPENTLFGMSEEDAREWRKLVEQRFGLIAKDPYECDVEGRRNFGQMQAAQFRAWLTMGEHWSEFVWRRRPGASTGTKVRLIPAYRVSRKSDPLRNIVNGVRMDADGFPLAYIAERRDPLLGTIEHEVPARDRFGRPRVTHAFDGALGTVRGISPLLPALQVARQFDQLADATLTAAIMQSVFAAVISSEAPTEEAMQGLLSPQEQARAAASGMSLFDAWFEAHSGWYESGTIDVGIKGRVAHTFPGERMEFLSPEQPTVHYREFALHLLREIMRCLGMTYESGTGDYLGATYTSVRMATTEIFNITQYRRQNIVAPFCQAFYEAWLEEEIEAGRIPFPGGIDNFIANRSAACRASWRGTPKPQADDLKAAKAHQVWREMGVITDAMIANDLGVDIEDVYADRAQERDLREHYGLPEPMMGHNGWPALDDDEEEEGQKEPANAGA